jgi:putative signal transducing protein
MEPVPLTIALNEVAAEEIRSLLHSEGIESMRRQSVSGVGSVQGSSGPQEILVQPRDLERARALIAED